MYTNVNELSYNMYFAIAHKNNCPKIAVTLSEVS